MALHRVLRLAAILASALSANSIAAFAQIGSSTDVITGTVVGPSGQPLVGARVEVVSVETETKRTRVTDEKGRYTILFPDGGGQYRVTVRFLGMLPYTFSLVRQADEDRLVADVRMSASAAQLATVNVEANRAPARGDRPEAGGVERMVTGAQLERLPIDPSDLMAIASLVPGIVTIPGTDSTNASFSVAGQRTDQNQVTLDGLSFGGGSVPSEAVRNTRVITNTYDVARGQFTGGQLATTTRSGTNFLSGSLNYNLHDPHLQWTDDYGTSSSFGGGYTQHQFSGGIGGPFVRDRAFWFGSAQLRRRFDPLRSLLTADPFTVSAFGAHPDSIVRFVQIAESFGFATGSNLTERRTNDNLTLLGRIDLNLGDAHALMLRGNWQGTSQEPSRVSALSLPHHGGTQSSDGSGAMLTLTSVLGRFLNEARASWSSSGRDGRPFLDAPEGRVEMRSAFGDSLRPLSTLELGGNPQLPTEDLTELLEAANELSWLSGGGGHRFKLGLLAGISSFDQTAGQNRNGTFVFHSLADFEAGRPSSYVRTLGATERTGSTTTLGAYLGDGWRPAPRWQLTYGARVDAEQYSNRPEYNSTVESLFGVRNDRFPMDWGVSPRLGFTWTSTPGGQAPGGIIGGGGPGGPGGPPGGGRGGVIIGGGGGGGGAGPGGGGMGGGGMMGMQGAGPGAITSTVVRGGVGLFRGRSPSGLFTAAVNQTGLPGAESQINCIGSSVPFPDWSTYLGDPAATPSSCTDGGTGNPVTPAAPNVTTFDPAFQTPATWRASIGASRRRGLFSASVDLTYAYGTNLYSVRDLNLGSAPAFALAAEGGRPVYAPAASIDSATGATTMSASRLHQQFGHVFEVNSNLGSRTLQLTTTLGGAAMRRMTWSTSYTITSSQDQSSYSGGGGTLGMGGGFGGLGGGATASAFASPTTAGNPNDVRWSRSDLERRHSLNGQLTWLAKPWLDVVAIARVNSGAPLTPRVSGDINGDGSRVNDRAFVFDPAGTADTALANGMARLLANAPGAARECLQPQIGQVAERNSCTGPWSSRVDMQLNLRPNLGARLQRRAQFAVTLTNLTAGIDRLFNGSDGLRGWGQQAFVEPTLLYVRGFDATSNQFVYAVNEQFGSSATARSALANPFLVTVRAQLQIGRDRQREMLEGALRGGSPDFRMVVERVAPDPAAAVLQMADSLRLSPEQRATIQRASDAFQARKDSLLARLDEETRKGGSGDLRTIFPRVQPILQDARAAYLSSAESLKALLTAEQWQRLPQWIANPSLPQQPPRQGPAGRVPPAEV